jgi:hypothetical protein
MSALRVELFFDEEAGNWHYRVPALHINGGGPPLARMPNATACPPSPSLWKAIPGTTTPTPKPSLRRERGASSVASQAPPQLPAAIAG